MKPTSAKKMVMVRSNCRRIRTRYLYQRTREPRRHRTVESNQPTFWVLSLGPIRTQTRTKRNYPRTPILSFLFTLLMPAFAEWTAKESNLPRRLKRFECLLRPWWARRPQERVIWQLQSCLLRRPRRPPRTFARKFTRVLPSCTMKDASTTTFNTT